MILIDNYDSFTYNIVQYLQELGVEPKVFENDKITINELKQLDFNSIIISPGAGNPDTAGISMDVIKEFYKTKKILGICLGHQCIAQFFGGKIVKSQNPTHGKTSKIFFDERSKLFKGLPQGFEVTRYHSLEVKQTNSPRPLGGATHVAMSNNIEQAFPLPLGADCEPRLEHFCKEPKALRRNAELPFNASNQAEGRILNELASCKNSGEGKRLDCHVANAPRNDLINYTKIWGEKVALPHRNDESKNTPIPEWEVASPHRNDDPKKMRVRGILKITAQTSDGTIMAIEHETLPIYGVQFHPEAILTQYGHELLANFINQR